MKPFILLFLFFVALTISNSSLADAWTHYGGACNWFSKRYKAHVGIKRNGEVGCYCCHTDANCSGVELECKYTLPVNNPPNLPFEATIARAYAIINANQEYSEAFGGYAEGRDWYAGADVSLKIPTYSRFPVIESFKFDKHKRVGGWARIGRIVYDTVNHVIHLYDITASIDVETYDKANDFAAIALSVSREPRTAQTEFVEPSDKEYVERLIWETKVMLNNGRLRTQGVISSKNFNNSVTSGKLNSSLNIEHIEIPISKNLDMSDLYVNLGVDNGSIGLGVSDKFNIENATEELTLQEPETIEEQLEFTNYPNPVSGASTEVYFELKREQNAQLMLCDGQGKPIKTLFEGTVMANQRKAFTIDLQLIKGPVGFFRLVLSDKILVRKILIQP
jgi:hypothetical protein